MKKQLSGILSFCLITGADITPIAAAESMSDSPTNDWQIRMLFEPSAHQIELERKGRVMIYSGNAVDLAISICICYNYQINQSRRSSMKKHHQVEFNGDEAKHALVI